MIYTESGYKDKHKKYTYHNFWLTIVDFIRISHPRICQDVSWSKYWLLKIMATIVILLPELLTSITFVCYELCNLKVLSSLFSDDNYVLKNYFYESARISKSKNNFGTFFFCVNTEKSPRYYRVYIVYQFI